MACHNQILLDYLRFWQKLNLLSTVSHNATDKIPVEKEQIINDSQYCFREREREKEKDRERRKDRDIKMIVSSKSTEYYQLELTLKFQAELFTTVRKELILI